MIIFDRVPAARRRPVELSYAEHFLAGTEPLCFTMLTPLGRFGGCRVAAAEDYARPLAEVWRYSASSSQIRYPTQLARRLRAAALLRCERWPRTPLRSEADRPVYLLVSQNCPSVCLIHDLIPIQFPEYALPGQDQRHRRRIETAAALADGVIVNLSVSLR